MNCKQPGFSSANARLFRFTNQALLFVPGVGAALLFYTIPALAHHSSAMFDSQRLITLHGTVKAFEWTNPHCFIQLAVRSANDNEEWSVEMGSVSQLFRLGWRPHTLRPGDNITVVVNPLRDGSDGGQFSSATTASGGRLIPSSSPIPTP